MPSTILVPVERQGECPSTDRFKLKELRLYLYSRATGKADPSQVQVGVWDGYNLEYEGVEGRLVSQFTSGVCVISVKDENSTEIFALQMSLPNDHDTILLGILQEEPVPAVQ